MPTENQNDALKSLGLTTEQFREHIDTQVKLQKASGNIRTMDDLLNAYYPWRQQPELLKKIDDPMTSATANVHNVVYGELVWEQLIMEANMWGVLEKRPWVISGRRVKKARGTHSDSIAETGDLPDADQPDIDVLEQDPAIAIHRFQITRVQELLSQTRDDAIGQPMNWLRNETAMEHRKALNEMLTTNVNNLPGTDWQSTDRLISSTSEITTLGYTADDENVENIDRSANSWFDANVDVAAVSRDLTKNMLRGAYRDARKYSGPNDKYVWVTGYDTLDAIAALYEPHGRFNFDAVKIQPSVNGVQVFAPGHDFGVHAATLFGDPIVVTNDMVQKGSISDIQYINLNRGPYLSILEPTQYAQQGVSNGNPWAKNKLVDDGIFWTIGNARILQPKTCSKITMID